MRRVLFLPDSKRGHGHGYQDSGAVAGDFLAEEIELAGNDLGLLDAAEKDSGKVIRRWKRLRVLSGQRVTVVFNGREFTGNCVGIDPESGLILQLETGGVRMFDAAHTTIAK